MAGRWLLVAGIIAAQAILFVTVGKLAGLGADLRQRRRCVNLPLLLILTGDRQLSASPGTAGSPARGRIAPQSRRR